MTTHRSTLPGRDQIATPLSGTRFQIEPSLRLDRSPLYRTFHAALALRGSTPVDVFCLGDSITTGAQASAKAKRWLSLAQDQLRTLFQPAGVVGGIGFVQMNDTYNSPWTHVGSPVQPVDGFSQNSASGPGLGGLDYPSGASSQGSFTATGFDVFYRKQSGAASFSISIDGASSGGNFVTVTTTNASEVDSAVQQMRVGLTAGTHTIKVAQVSGTPHIEGVRVFNGDETSGIRFVDSGRTGIPTGFYSTTNTKWLGAVNAIQPALMTVLLGTNNYRLSGSPPTAMAQDLITLIRAARAQCTIPPSVLLIAPYLPSNSTGTNGFQAYYDALYRAAGVLGDVDVLDLYWKFGTDVQTNALGLLNADLTHPSDKGYQFIADAVVGRIRPGGA